MSKVTRGRTAADVPEAMKQNANGLASGSREEKAHSSGRPPRISMGNMKKLEIPENLKEAGFYYRWFQDRDGRLNQAKAAYYEPVVDEQGNNYTRSSGPYSMHLMRLPQKYRDEDNRLKKERVASTMETEAALSANEYAPDAHGRREGGTSAITRTESDNPYS